MKLFISIIALCCSCINLYGAGFDCKKAATNVEHLVCNNSHISNLDSQLNRLYRMRTCCYGEHISKVAKDDQAYWLKSVRDKCLTDNCLIEAYSSRIEKLSSVITSISEGEYVFDSEEFSKQESDFRNSLAKSGALLQLSACPVMIRLNDNTYTGRDISYGAFCFIKSRNNVVMICDDSMIGKLTLKMSGFAIFDEELVDFTKTNCPPGG